MPDVFTKPKRSQVMSRIRARGNKDTELALAILFRRNRISGWRRHVLIVISSPGGSTSLTRKGSQVRTLRRGKGVRKNVDPHPAPSRRVRVSRSGGGVRVRPDFVFRKERVAVFVDGCFWHGCPKHCNQPANNREFWRRKLAGNRERDALVSRTLRRGGWRVLRIWEHELGRRNEARLGKRIGKMLKAKSSSEF